jgi:hypothetical protein
MAETTDGQDPGQGASAPKEGDAGEGKVDRLADMEARFDLLNDSLSELRQAILERRPSAAPAPVEEIDDDEPLTASKVKKIVQSSVSTVAAANQSLVQRQQWDSKAKEEFPLADPKFLREFKAVWKEQTSSGLDPTHPKAVYNVAQITARAMGVKKPVAKADPETSETSEAPTSASPAARQARNGASRSSVTDDDPRLNFYKMKGDRTKDQIDAMKKKLGDRDAARRSNK